MATYIYNIFLFDDDNISSLLLRSALAKDCAGVECAAASVVRSSVRTRPLTHTMSCRAYSRGLYRARAHMNIIMI